ncbi:hypothetical protein [Peptoniphilus grossensis]|uniref:hypothetical protein n=1 Tax=Peptoniphilus grossensis TaxID=1465756 RepID=UPI0002E1934E|nr:hypothetical protein [Peptoniphilus grossensis]
MNNKTLEEYSVYSPFDIKKHKETYINYLEVLILEEGTVEYAVPSHQEKALEIACKKLNKTKQEIEDMCPREYYCDYLTWLLGITGSISVWGTNDEYFIVYKTINKKQIATLKKLKKHGLYKGNIPII